MKLQNDTAVSPVVGVMLMLVVTIIIAAVVSGFAGGLVGTNNQKAPKLTIDARIVNGGILVQQLSYDDRNRCRCSHTNKRSENCNNLEQNTTKWHHDEWR